MAGSDRAFRALAHHEPDTVARTLRLLAPDLFASAAALTRADVAPTRLDALAPPRDADSLLRAGDELAHTECQGYRDTGFPERVFWYHLEFACVHRPLRVRTVALWLTRPPEAQRRERLAYGDIEVRVRHVLLPEVPAELLLGDTATACFAAAADPGARTVEALCREVARSLRASAASFYRRHMAVVCAATQGRYDAMVKAMASEGLEPVVIEDLVKFGEDRGLEKGLEQGHEQVLTRLFARRLGRPLQADEGAALQGRLRSLGAERLSDVVLELEGDALARWLADPNASLTSTPDARGQQLRALSTAAPPAPSARPRTADALGPPSPDLTTARQ